MTGAKPRIGVTGPAEGAFTSRVCIALGVRMAGATPVHIRPHDDIDALDISGAVIAGGTDIHPALYGGAAKRRYAYDTARDTAELRLIARAEREKLPLLGICRGAQLINVSRGGDLHPDIAKAFERAEYPNNTLAHIFYRKRIYISPGSLLARLAGGESRRVNSIHSQAVNRAGAYLSVTAKEANGVPQAIEDNRFPFFLGVQFHPEYLLYSRSYRAIFRALAREAARL